MGSAPFLPFLFDDRVKTIPVVPDQGELLSARLALDLMLAGQGLIPRRECLNPNEVDGTASERVGGRIQS